LGSELYEQVFYNLDLIEKDSERLAAVQRQKPIEQHHVVDQQEEDEGEGEVEMGQ
jgi:hypothetical protein